MLLLDGEATQTNLIVFGFTQPKMDYTIYCNRCEHTNLYNNEMGFCKGRITLREHLSSPRFLVGSVFLIFLVFCVSFRSECRFVMSVTISALSNFDCSFSILWRLFHYVSCAWKRSKQSYFTNDKRSQCDCMNYTYQHSCS